MSEFFDKVRNAPSTYVDAADGVLTDVRIVIYRHGEDPEKVMQTFYEEHRGHCSFAIIPLPSYGNPPRRELCSQKSLVDALQTVHIERNSTNEQQWKAVCDFHSVAWPKRLTQVA